MGYGSSANVAYTPPEARAAQATMHGPRVSPAQTGGDLAAGHAAEAGTTSPAWLHRKYKDVEEGMRIDARLAHEKEAEQQSSESSEVLESAETVWEDRQVPA